jgi:PAS domain S-box-containing protein
LGSAAGRDETGQQAIWPAALADSADPIWILDTEDRIVGWNRAASEVFGYAREEILGQPLARLVPPDLLAAGELEELAAVLAERGAVSDYETRRLRKDGTEVEVSLTRTLLRDRSGRPIGSVTVVRDLSARRRFERQMLEAEKLVTVGEVAASVAQEIGAPITSLGLVVERLRRDPDVAARYGEDLATAQALLERVGRLARQLVELAKPGAPHFRTVDPATLLRDAVALVAPSFERAGIRVDLALAEPLPRIQADPRQLEQVIANLLLNAQAALAGRRRPRVRVEARVVPVPPAAGAPKREALEVRVSDNGPGIAPEDLPQIFRPFFSRFGGAGLGLSLARRLAHQHGGTLDVESTPGAGATFILQLPLDAGT